MEIKAELLEPYTDIQKFEFIEMANDNNYSVEYCADKLEAWGYTQEEEEEIERERISHLKCTKRVLALILEQLGFSYKNQIKPLIDENDRASLEWELCVELERCNPLLDIFGQQLGISSEQIDAIFKYANGEIETLEVE
jgi:hypothetical protein